MGSLVPEKMTRQSLRTQSFCQKQPSSPLAWSPRNSPLLQYKTATPEKGVPQEARTDAG